MVGIQVKILYHSSHFYISDKAASLNENIIHYSEEIRILRRVTRLTETDRNGPTKIPKRTSMGTQGSERTSVGTETDRNRLQLIPKRTSMGTRKGRVGYDRNDPHAEKYQY